MSGPMISLSPPLPPYPKLEFRDGLPLTALTPRHHTDDFHSRSQAASANIMCNVSGKDEGDATYLGKLGGRRLYLGSFVARLCKHVWFASFIQPFVAHVACRIFGHALRRTYSTRMSQLLSSPFGTPTLESARKFPRLISEPHSAGSIQEQPRDRSWSWRQPLFGSLRCVSEL